MRPLELRVPYHQPCQGRGHGIGKPALDLLRLIPGLEVIEVERECCGVAGTYGLKREKYPIAMQVGASLFADIADARADCTACDSETCRWHIAKATGIPAVHPVELLHRAYGL
jgi:glycerol-3-phosphate dehydrogenase subunit C